MAGPAETPLPHPARRWWPVVLIAAVSAGAHLWCLGSRFYLDDLWQIRDNTFVREGTWWRLPALQWTYLWYVVEARVFGMSPMGFHLVNWLLHTAVAVVTYLAGRRFLEGCGGARAALVGALLFACHPLGSEIPNYARTQDIAWVTLFSLLAAWMTVRFLDTRRGVMLALALAAAVGATLSKGPGIFHALMMMAVAVPGFVQRGDLDWVWRKRWWVLGGLAALVATSVLVGGWWGRWAEDMFGAATGLRALTLSRVFWHFVQLTVWPVGLCADHHTAPTTSWRDTAAVAAFAGSLLWIAASAILLARPRTRQLGACLLLFVGAIAFRIGFSGGEFMPEYRIYPGLPWIGLAAGIAVTAAARRGGLVKRAVRGATTVVVLVFISLSAGRAFQWHSLETLMADVLRQYPTQTRAIWVLQRDDLDHGRFEQVVARQDAFMRAANAARAYVKEHEGVRTLGYDNFLLAEIGCQGLHARALAATRGPEAALAHLERVRTHLEQQENALDIHWGEYHHAHGLVLEQAGRLEEAAESLRQAGNRHGRDLDLQRVEEKLGR